LGLADGTVRTAWGGPEAFILPCFSSCIRFGVVLSAAQAGVQQQACGVALLAQQSTALRLCPRRVLATTWHPAGEWEDSEGGAVGVVGSLAYRQAGLWALAVGWAVRYSLHV
jgi:hypothetical protein